MHQSLCVWVQFGLYCVMHGLLVRDQIMFVWTTTWWSPEYDLLWVHVWLNGMSSYWLPCFGYWVWTSRKNLQRPDWVFTRLFRIHCFCIWLSCVVSAEVNLASTAQTEKRWFGVCTWLCMLTTSCACYLFDNCGEGVLVKKRHLGEGVCVLRVCVKAVFKAPPHWPSLISISRQGLLFRFSVVHDSEVGCVCCVSTSASFLFVLCLFWRVVPFSGSHRLNTYWNSNLVDPASSHTLVSKIKPCMSKYKQLYSETANGSLYQL